MEFEPLALEQLAAWAGLLAVTFGRTPAGMSQWLASLHQAYPVVAWGAWHKGQLVAQYSCLVVRLAVPSCPDPLVAGMSVNMAVHPDYRGQGLVKHLARPVYEAIQVQGGRAGVGFSNAAGVQVDRHSKGYGYQVVGQLCSRLFFLGRRQTASPLRLTTHWPGDLPEYLPAGANISFLTSPAQLAQRFAYYPTQPHHFGVWEGEGVVIYRPVKMGPFPAVSLLAVYGADSSQLLQRWISALQQQGIYLVHLLTTPAAQVAHHLQKLAFGWSAPYTRHPYFLTLKSLGGELPAEMWQFNRWDCLGGEVL